jgi:hypothetical protein
MQLAEEEGSQVDSTGATIATQAAKAQDESRSAEEKGYHYDPANAPPTTQTEVEDAGSLATPSHEPKGLSALARGAQKLFAPTGLTDDPDIKKKALALGALRGRTARTKTRLNTLKAVMPALERSPDVGGGLVKLGFGDMFPGVGSGSLPPPVAKSGTVNEWSTALAASGGDPARAWNMVTDAKLQRAVAGKPTYGELPNDPRNFALEAFRQHYHHDPSPEQLAKFINAMSKGVDPLSPILDDLWKDMSGPGPKKDMFGETDPNAPPEPPAPTGKTVIIGGQPIQLRR